jgi:surface polysaccharide O-acyltransferase-like enzyme
MSKKKEYITILNTISAIAVVFLHTNGCFWDFNKEKYWITANIIECLFYFAVPIFFMISGAKFVEYQDRYSTKEFFKKRAKKVLIPFICWGIIALFYLLFTKTISIHGIDIKYILNGLMNGSFVSIYWFFPPLLCIYLCMPLFASVKEEKRKVVFSYIAIIGFILNALIPFIINIFKLDIIFPYSISVCFGFLIYVFIGYLLDKYDMKKRDRYIIYALAIIGLLMHIIGTYKLSYESNMIVDTFKGYVNVPCILYSVGIFVFVKEICKKTKKILVLNKIVDYTFGIYLIHFFIIDIINKVFEFNIRSIFYRLGLPFIVIPLCMLITFILRKIPIVKKIVP